MSSQLRRRASLANTSVVLNGERPNPDKPRKYDVVGCVVLRDADDLLPDYPGYVWVLAPDLYGQHEFAVHKSKILRNNQSLAEEAG